MELRRPVLFAGLGRALRGVAGERAGAPVDAQLDAAVEQLGEGSWQEARRDPRVDHERLGGVADARPLRLRVHRDPDGHVEVRVGVDVHVAVARRRVHHRHGGVLLERGLQPLAAARDDQVDEALGRRDLAQLVAVAAGH